MDTYGLQVFQDWLQRRFESVGRGKIDRGEFVLEDTKTKKEINLACRWETSFYAGMHVAMGMVYRDRSWDQTASCPSCQTPYCGNADQEIDWQVLRIQRCRV
jgi:hypothetical protein